MPRRWTEEDDRLLVWYWGMRDPKAIAKMLQRTVTAINIRMRTLTGTSSQRRGLYTLTRLEQETGYTRHQIKAAVTALGLLVRARGARKPWRVTEEQKTQILDWLREDSVPLVTGTTYTELANRLGCQSDTVRAIANKLRIDGLKGARVAQLTEYECERIAYLYERRKGVQRGDVWALRYDSCVMCETVETPHKGHGLCRQCYDGTRR